MIIQFIKKNFLLFKAKKTWRKNNSHNFTSINSLFNQSLCSVGNYTYGTINLSTTNNLSKVKIGNYCSIANNVLFIVNNEHELNYISTYPFKARLLKLGSESTSKGDIIVGDDVWIGNDVKVLSGVQIGQGAVIAAGAVVTKNVPPYAIVGGVPAKIIKYRFSEKIIKKLIKIDYSLLTVEQIEKNIDKFYETIDLDETFEWLPLR